MSTTSFRVMSFNIRVATAADGPNLWANRADLNLRTIRKYDPDIIGFQELQKPQWTFYEQTLTDYESIQGPPYNNTESAYAYPSIFIRPQRFELVDQTGFWLSPTPDCHSMGWDTNCVRSALAVKLRCRESGRSLVVLNTHLDHRGQQARLEGARLICQQLDAFGQPGQTVLVAGDFNCDPQSDPYNQFQQAGYRDTFLDAGQEDGQEVYTFHAFTGKRALKPTHGRIDWILHRPGTFALRVVDACIIRDAEPPLYPSDHFPVLTQFESAE